MILPLFFAANMSDIKRLMFDGKPAENLDSAGVVYANCRKSLVAMQGWRNAPSIISTECRSVTATIFQSLSLQAIQICH